MVPIAFIRAAVIVAMAIVMSTIFPMIAVFVIAAVADNSLPAALAFTLRLLLCDYCHAGLCRIGIYQVHGIVIGAVNRVKLYYRRIK